MKTLTACSPASQDSITTVGTLDRLEERSCSVLLILDAYKSEILYYLSLARFALIARQRRYFSFDGRVSQTPSGRLYQSLKIVIVAVAKLQRCLLQKPQGAKVPRISYQPGEKAHSIGFCSAPCPGLSNSSAYRLCLWKGRAHVQQYPCVQIEFE